MPPHTRHAGLLLGAILLFSTGAAAQQSLVHTCGPDIKLRQTLDSFTDKTKPNTLEINGVCDTSENPLNSAFTVAGFTNLTIKAGPGGATLSAVSSSCVPGAPAPAGANVLAIFDSARVALENIQITGGRGLAISNSNVLATTPANTTGNVVSGSRTTGISISNGGTVSLSSKEVVENNCQHGIAIGGSSSLTSAATVRNNGDTGIIGTSPAAVSLQSGTKIHGNGTAGISYSGPGRVVAGGTEIYGNGLAPVGVNASTPGGVTGVGGAFAQLVSANIHDNSGPGVSLRLNATGALTNTTIQGHTAGGLNLQAGSVADLNTSIGPNTLQGNGAGSIGDVNCDAFSQVFGDVSGVFVNKCPLQANGR